jgi:hypothetical protein
MSSFWVMNFRYVGIYDMVFYHTLLQLCLEYYEFLLTLGIWINLENASAATFFIPGMCSTVKLYSHTPDKKKMTSLMVDW